jgi:hypothetical protein
MPSARDLMQKADSLMKSNRNVGVADSDEAVPVLTDIAVPGRSGISHRQYREDIPIQAGASAATQKPLPDTANWDSGLMAPAPVRPVAPVVIAAPAQSATEIAEAVYYQVLQHLDLYTENALQEHLTTHLSPILERTSRELLASLHANLGGLIRQYVADAIEKQLGVRPPSSK